MTRFILSAFLAAAVAGPAFAETNSHEIRFTRDGTDYVATVSEQGGGVQTIVGTEVRSNRRFDLRVDRGHVSGTYGGQAISYTLGDVRAAKTTQLSAR